jgi:uncharacterized protein (TIGR00299 family) protein
VSAPRQLWIDASAGIAGDMVLGALIDAGADLAVVQSAVDAVIGNAVTLSCEAVTRAGQHGNHLSVQVNTEDGASREWRVIKELITNADLAAPIRDRALACFGRLAEVEAKVHHLPQDQVHFHEVGALDSIADIVGVAAALHALQIERISASAVAVGSGRARGAHGDLGVPVPAVVELATGWTIFAGGPGELTTPTGMALLSALAESCEDLPLLTLQASGTGGGQPRYPRPTQCDPSTDRRAGCRAGDGSSDAAVVIEANVDDLDPRLWPGVLSSLLTAGAADAWLVPITMKKGRPAHTLTVLAQPDHAAQLRELVLRQTSTIGVRQSAVRKTALPRGWIDLDVAGSQLPIKIAYRDGTIWQVTPEFDELDRAAAASGMSPRALLEEANATAAAVGLVTGARVPDGLRSSRG